MIYAILLFGLDIVVGYTGQVSLGHAGLFGIGAYTAGVLVMKLGRAVCGSRCRRPSLVTAVFGALLALPALRVTGPYLAMVTLAFGTIIQILINEMTFLTERPDGHQAHEARRCSAIALDEREFYWLVRGAAWCWRWSSCTASCARTSGAPSRRCAAARSRPTAWASRSTATRSTPSSSAPASPGWPAACTPIPSSTSRPNTYNFELTVLFLLAVIMGGRKSPHRRRCSAPRSSCCCPSCSTTSSCSAIVVGRARGAGAGRRRWSASGAARPRAAQMADPGGRQHRAGGALVLARRR